MIDKKTLEKLAALVRIDIEKKEENALIHDLKEILNHFEELNALDTSGVSPMTGGTLLTNEFREDDVEDKGLNNDLVKEQFPGVKNGFLKIPPVFE